MAWASSTSRTLRRPTSMALISARFRAAGQTLAEFALQVAARLEESEAETLEGVAVGPGLRPWGEEAASIRYRSGGAVVEEGKIVTRPGTEVVGWQVVLLSPDGETFLLITFDVWGEEFDGWLEPFLRDIVRRVQWLEHPAYDPPVGPTVTITRTMYVRGGPGTDHPILGTVAAGQQYAGISTNAAGDWWQIEYDGQLAWVYGGFVTPSTDAESALQADAAGWLTYDDVARGLSLSYPSGWHFFDPAQPTRVDLALFSAAVKGRAGEQLRRCGDGSHGVGHERPPRRCRDRAWPPVRTGGWRVEQLHARPLFRGRRGELGALRADGSRAHLQHRGRQRRTVCGVSDL